MPTSTFLPEPPELQVVMQAARTAKISQLCPLPQKSTRGAIIMCVVRNEIHRLPDFFRHHRNLGFERFVFIDNGSDDGTLEYLIQQCDTGVFATSEPFHWTAKHGWIMRVIERLGLENWFALLDADEHLVFAHCETRTIRELVFALESRGITRARACLVDMYSDQAVFGEHDDKGGLEVTYPYFDTNGYSEHRSGRLTIRTGGPRGRMAAALGRDHSPALTKYPIFKLGKGEVAYNPHLIWPPLDAADDPCLLALKHYKFDTALAQKVTYALQTRAYWNDSAEYALYDEWSQMYPGQSLLYSGSALYHTTQDFVACGLIDEIEELGFEPSIASRLERARTISRASEFTSISLGGS